MKADDEVNAKIFFSSVQPIVRKFYNAEVNLWPKMAKTN